MLEINFVKVRKRASTENTKTFDHYYIPDTYKQYRIHEHMLRASTTIHANSATSSSQRRRSVRCYARTTRRAPLRKRCGALAS